MKIDCGICGRRYNYPGKGHLKTKCNSCSVKKNQRKRLQRLVEMKGSCCQRCSYDTSKWALCFHHIDPLMKCFPLSVNHMTRHTWKILIEEAKKCILLCANCHLELHAGEWLLKEIEVII